MVFLRYLYVVALVLWVGGLVVAGAVVAPSVFGVLQAWNATENPGERLSHVNDEEREKEEVRL